MLKMVRAVDKKSRAQRHLEAFTLSSLIGAWQGQEMKISWGPTVR